MRISGGFWCGVSIAIAVGAGFANALPDPTVTGTGISFTGLPAYPGSTVVIRAAFNVAGGAANVTASVEQTSPRPTGPPPPTVILGTFNPGGHTVDVYRYTVPASPPDRICFAVKMSGGAFRDVCMRRGRGLRGSFMDVDSPGQWIAGSSIPAPVASAEKPDLRITGRLDLGTDLRIDNIGRGTAYGVRAIRECFVDGVWVPSGPAFGEKSTLGPGAFIPLRIGRLAKSIGPFPAGTTKVRIVVDPENRTDETREDNNVLEVATLADLRIADFFAFGYKDELRVRFKITNTGVNDAGRFAWDISLLMNGEWRSFKGETVAGLQAGGQVDKIVLIGMILRGVYYIPDNRGYGSSEVNLRLRVDGLNQVPESNEGDNTSETAIRR
jgi:hypothetical protein